jgi:hypothetical protein
MGMGTFDFPKIPLTPENWTKLLGALGNTNSHDYDSGWVALPANNQFRHNLAQLPGHVQVFSSGDARGNGYKTDAATSVDNNYITVSGTAKFYRVTANK